MDGGRTVPMVSRGCRAINAAPRAGVERCEVGVGTSAADDDAGQATFETTACHKPPKVTDVWRRRVARSCKTQRIERSVDGDVPIHAARQRLPSRGTRAAQQHTLRYASAQRVSRQSPASAYLLCRRSRRVPLAEGVAIVPRPTLLLRQHGVSSALQHHTLPLCDACTSLLHQVELPAASVARRPAQPSCVDPAADVAVRVASFRSPRKLCSIVANSTRLSPTNPPRHPARLQTLVPQRLWRPCSAAS
jgi:hypothetical protein